MPMNEEQFVEWAHHPVNAPFRQYLNDCRESLKDRWASGDNVSEKDHAFVVACGDILTLEWADVAVLWNPTQR